MPNANKAKTKSAPKFFAAGLLLLALMAAAFIYGELATPTASLNGHKLQLEIVRTDAAKQRGLSGRAGLEQNKAMLFSYDTAGDYGIWMKDMKFNLDIIWFDPSKVITHIEKNISPASYPTVYRSPTPAQYIIEMNAGLADSFGLAIGQQARFDN